MTVDVPSGVPADVATPEPGDPRLARLSLNQWTTRGWELPDLVAGCVASGVPGVGLWRETVAEHGLREVSAMVRDAGLHVTSLCRGGFLTLDDREASLADNRLAVQEAAGLGADCLVLVVGGLPAGERDLLEARRRVVDRLEVLATVAQDHGVRLGLEPLHPMYCADRAVLSTLRQALDLAEPFPSDVVGVVVDTFHVWWDPELDEQLRRAGRDGRIASYQVADWILPMPADPLLARGMMGDGVVDFASVTEQVAQVGYRGHVEVEIFNADVWASDPGEVLSTVTRRYVRDVQPFLT